MLHFHINKTNQTDNLLICLGNLAEHYTYLNCESCVSTRDCTQFDILQLAEGIYQTEYKNQTLLIVVARIDGQRRQYIVSAGDLDAVRLILSW